MRKDIKKVQSSTSGIVKILSGGGITLARYKAGNASKTRKCTK